LARNNSRAVVLERSVGSAGTIVARELGVPCVIDTRVGTRTLRTGDLVRVDGGADRVEVLERG
jgi:pyruvate,water dikinase